MCDKIKLGLVYISNVLSHLWLVGTLFRAGWKTQLAALYEFTYLFLWSILPFAVGALTLYVTSEATDKNFYTLGVSTFNKGELLVFTISMLAPILYLTLYDPDHADPFPHRLPISTLVALIMVACASLFALLKANAVKDIPFVFEFSVILTLLALVFRYLAIVYHRVRMPNVSERELRSPQNSFVNQYRKHVASEAQDADDFKKSFEDHLEAAK